MLDAKRICASSTHASSSSVSNSDNNATISKGTPSFPLPPRALLFPISSLAFCEIEAISSTAFCEIEVRSKSQNPIFPPRLKSQIQNPPRSAIPDGHPGYLPLRRPSYDSDVRRMLLHHR
ncbi:hypothetical protein Taro_017365 [Colocasia esculenta]|uniref:Uncharacterized protein n=1 Tax=Colocasia esculenta TaxID=4460 RepID=A0A843UQZ0_COLES|nr:hypothetical protein [Colocasia esculenta]